MKKNYVLFLSLAVLAIGALTCAAAPVITPVQPTAEYTETVNASPDKVFDAFVKYFADNGITLETSDKSFGTIITDRIEITDNEVIPYYRKVTGDKSEYKDKGVNFGYCDCGMPDIGFKGIWRNLYYKYTVQIKKVNGNTTQFRVKAKFWTELYKMMAFAVVEYQNDWDCASTGEYEKKLIEEIKTNYLKK